MRKHAILSASSAHRWLNCTPSARLEEPLPDSESTYADEGSLAHRLAELTLLFRLRWIEERAYLAQLQHVQSHELFTADMMDYVTAYADFVIEQYNEARSRSQDAVIFLEERLDFSRWVPEGFGTGDCTIISDGVMEIIDFKYGKGVEVEAEDNPQMMLYALGAHDTFGYIYSIHTVRMTIHQPRIGNVSTWELPLDKLLKWATLELKPKAIQAWNGQGEPRPGDWCRFCKVKERCRARAEAMMAIPNAFNYKKPELLEIEEIAELLYQLEAVQAWAKEIQEFALAQARDHGVKFPGWKLVEGRSNREYTDPEEVANVLKAAKYRVKDIYEMKLIGITAMEKLLGKQRFKELLEDPGLVRKPPGKPVLVVESDKRPEINSAAADFEFQPEEVK